MEYKDFETVTLSLERYEEMKNEIQELKDELDRIKEAFSVERVDDKSIKVIVNKEILKNYLKVGFRYYLFPFVRASVKEVEYR